MANDLLIKINADAKNATKAFNDIKSQTENLEGNLNNVAIGAGVAFAALTAEIYLSTKAFEEARQVAAELDSALQNQGIYTAELASKYENLSNKIQAKTGIDNDAVKSAFAVAQGFLGQREITDELGNAIADLGTKMKGDFSGAAEKIARTIGTGTNAFAKQGLVISAAATEAQRYQQVLEFVQMKAGGLAAEMDKADGGARRLATSFGNAQEALGARFAPVVAVLRNALSSLLDLLGEDSILTDFVAGAIAAAAAVAGIVTAVSVVIPVILSLQAGLVALQAAGFLAGATLGTLALPILGIFAAAALLVAGIVLIARNWDVVSAFLKSSVTATVTFVSELFSGLGKVLSGAFNLDPSQISAGLAQIKESFKKAKDVGVEAYTEIRATQIEAETLQAKDKKDAADRVEADKRQHQANLLAIEKAGVELVLLQNNDASQALIENKQKEIEILKAIDAEENQSKLQALRDRYAILQAEEMMFREQDLEESLNFESNKATAIAELEAEGFQLKYDLSAQQQQQLRALVMTEKEAEQAIIAEKLKARIDANNTQLLETKKFGATYAAINRILHSEEVQGAKTAANELVQLQGSKSKELKEIGKIAAVAQVTISTAESAMNIFKGFSTIPIVGPALGVAGAAAAVAFGGERIAQITAANQGGLISGGIPGRDSVPALLTPGELVVPERNFDQVVGAVRNEGAAGNDSEMIAVLTRIEEKISSGTSNNFYGDVQADDSYIDALIRRISDAVEFRNAQIFGVTA